MNFRVGVPVAVDFELFQSIRVLKSKGVKISEDGMVSNFGHIELVETVLPKLLYLALLEFIVLTVFVNFPDLVPV